MRPAARVQAAIDVLGECVQRHRPASAALADWGKSHRFAGSGDRAAIGNMVYDALRRRAGAEHLMKSKSARALVLGSLQLAAGLSVEDIAALCDGGQHAVAPLDDSERRHLEAGLGSAPPHVLAEVPTWAWPSFQQVFGERAIAEGRALAERAPVDLRVNLLASDRARVLAELSKHGAEPTPWSQLGVRIRAPSGTGRHPNVEAELAHGRGWFEVQDEGSQVAAALSGAHPGHRVLDMCAGAGGKTLALAAALRNQGQIIAYDEDKIRLRPIMERLKRSGATCVEVLAAGDIGKLSGTLFDIVLVDAPCTGAGTWRRKPDAKWRTRPASLDKRVAEQRAVLDTAAPFVRAGGRLVYVTCSIFGAENTQQTEAFLTRHPSFRIVPTAQAWAGATPGTLAATAPASADGRTDTLLLTPATHGTDGFYVAVLERVT